MQKGQFLQRITKILTRGSYRTVQLACGHEVFAVRSTYRVRAHIECATCERQRGTVPNPIYKIITLGGKHWVVGNSGEDFWTPVSTDTKSRAKAERDLQRIRNT